METTVTVQKNRYNYFNVYSREVDVIKHLRHANRTRKQDTQCTNICRSISAFVQLFVAVEKQRSECVSVAFHILHAKRLRHIVICLLSNCNKILYIISQIMGFPEKKIWYEKFVLFFVLNFVRNISHSKKN